MLGAGGDRAVERGLAPDKALGLKMLNDVLAFIDVRFAGEARCSPDIASREETK